MGDLAGTQQNSEKGHVLTEFVGEHLAHRSWGGQGMVQAVQQID